MMFLPKGTTYEYKKLSGEGLYTSINFLADLSDPKPTAYSLENFYEAEYLCNHFTDLWKFGTQAEKYKCFSLLYDLLSYVSNIENANYADKTKFKIIAPAVNYLKEHIYDCSLKAEKLPQLCGISGTYFRKIFTARFGTTPQNYIMQKRLTHAKSILDSGDFDTVREVALSVGYNDPLYFGKSFKKIYGISPSEINK
ncbi:MAG: helix-turn-helix transcriptional regulator [Clostridia bacterium]|nr:helix-turn-helix transcriptional regulator [Clostridia bacterium]